MPRIDGPRACIETEIPEVIALVDDAMRQGTNQSMLTDYPLLYAQKNLDNIRILREDGEMAAVVPFLPHDVVMEDCHFRIGIISATATAVHHRKKGYGLKCLESCVQVMEQTGCDISVLWTRLETFPFYGHADFEPVRTQGGSYRCNNKDAPLFQNRGEQVIEYDPQSRLYLDAIREMHEREVFGALRLAEEYPFLFSLPKMKTLIALRQSVPVAYLLISNAINKPGLLEGGGHQEALETLVHRALSDLGEGQFLEAHDYLTPSTLGNLFEQQISTRKEPGRASMMVRINNPSVFINKIANWLEKSNHGVSREFSLGVSGVCSPVSLRFSEGGLEVCDLKSKHHLEMSRTDLAALIFGSHSSRTTKEPEIMGDLFPYYFPVWWLDRS